MGSTFAIMPGTVDTAGQVSSVQFKIDPSDVHPGTGRQDHAGHRCRRRSQHVDSAGDRLRQGRERPGRQGLIHSGIRLDRQVEEAGEPISSAGLSGFRCPRPDRPPRSTPCRSGTYETTGNYLVGFYLPGDATGTGTVTRPICRRSCPSWGHGRLVQVHLRRRCQSRRQDLARRPPGRLQEPGGEDDGQPRDRRQSRPGEDGPLHSRITNFRTVHFTGSSTPGATVTFTEVKSNSPARRPRPTPRATTASWFRSATGRTTSMSRPPTRSASRSAARSRR